MTYMKQFDGIRALGIFTVFYVHYIGWQVAPLQLFGYEVYFGSTCLDAFFVMSGYLITSILLKGRSKAEEGRMTTADVFKQFYTRRFLRIFPIYYLTLFIIFILNTPHARESIWWDISYLANYNMSRAGTWDFGSITHLWSLSVEEQFYLVWPCIILLMPKKALSKALIVVIAMAPVFRYYCLKSHTPIVTPFVLTLGNVDLLGIGSLLAYLKTYQKANLNNLQIFLKVCLYLGGFMYLVSIVLSTFKLSGTLVIFNRTFIGLFLCWILDKATDGFSGVLGRVLEFRPLMYLGKISYGLYLYHFFMPSLAKRLLTPLYVSIQSSLLGQYVLYSTMTVIDATMSWYLIEKPIGSFKDSLLFSGKKSQITTVASLDVKRSEYGKQDGSVIPVKT